MGFTTPCFIRKNTPELIKKLQDMGYFYTYYYNGSGIYCYNNIAQSFTYNNEIPKECIGIPKNNEELFIALVALRDDTDKNQYFICDKVSVTLGKTYYPGDYLYYQYDEFFDKQNWHKATVKEIIEHFKYIK